MFIASNKLDASIVAIKLLTFIANAVNEGKLFSFMEGVCLIRFLMEFTIFQFGQIVTAVLALPKTHLRDESVGAEHFLMHPSIEISANA